MKYDVGKTFVGFFFCVTAYCKPMWNRDPGAAFAVWEAKEKKMGEKGWLKRIWGVLGGGGFFGDKAWTDHEWLFMGGEGGQRWRRSFCRAEPRVLFNLLSLMHKSGYSTTHIINRGGSGAPKTPPGPSLRGRPKGAGLLHWVPPVPSEPPAILPYRNKPQSP